MRTQLGNFEGSQNPVGKLLVDPETGRVLRADGEVMISRRALDSHPYICRIYVGDDWHYVAGPGAYAAKRTGHLNPSGNDVQYRVVEDVAGLFTIHKVAA